MMLSLHGFPSEADAFLYFLAAELGKTVGELDSMSHAEYLGWVSYHKARNAVRNQRRVANGG